MWVRNTMLQVLNKGQILCKLQSLKMQILWANFEMLQDLSKMCKGVGAGALSYAGGYRCMFAQVSGVYSYASGNIFVFM